VLSAPLTKDKVKHCLLTFTATAALSGSLAASLQRSREKKSQRCTKKVGKTSRIILHQ
jgi:hypothetical protein